MTYDEFTVARSPCRTFAKTCAERRPTCSAATVICRDFASKPSVVAIRVPWDVYDRLAVLHPEAFVDFPHYRGTPYLTASLPNLDPNLAQELLKEAWQAAYEVIGPR